MDQNEFDEPTENDKELTAFVTRHEILSAAES
jgi:hypothetical protein